MQNLILQIASAQQKRIASIPQTKEDSILCRVESYDVNTGSFRGIAPDGGARYFRHIGNAALAIGDQVSVTLPEGSIVGWGDTNAR